MNLLRSTLVFSIPLLFTLVAQASGFFLEKSDFKNAQETKRAGKILVATELSESGQAKMQSLHASDVGQKIEIHIAGQVLHLVLRDPIQDNRLEIGPFSKVMAAKAVQEINARK